MNNSTVTLRAPEPADIDLMWRLENDPQIWQCGDTPAPLSRHMIEQYVLNYSADPLSDRQLRLMVCVAGNDTPVGMVDLFDIDILNLRAGVGIVIAEPFRRRGYATRALCLLSDYAAQTLGLHQLWCHIAADNGASRHTFERAGFKSTGLLPAWLRRQHKYIDAYHYCKPL